MNGNGSGKIDRHGKGKVGTNGRGKVGCKRCQGQCSGGHSTVLATSQRVLEWPIASTFANEKAAFRPRKNLVVHLNTNYLIDKCPLSD